jgi:hypothetical protein
MSLEDYKELPTVVQTLNYHCEDYDEKLDLFCPASLSNLFWTTRYWNNHLSVK